MSKNLPSLSRREREILEILHDCGRATAAEVLDYLDGDASYTAVRELLFALELKGHVRHADEEGRSVYVPVVSRHRAARAALQHAVETASDDAPSRAIAAALGTDKRLGPDDIARLAKLVQRARVRGKI